MESTSGFPNRQSNGIWTHDTEFGRVCGSTEFLRQSSASLTLTATMQSPVVWNNTFCTCTWNAIRVRITTSTAILLPDKAFPRWKRCFFLPTLEEAEKQAKRVLAGCIIRRDSFVPIEETEERAKCGDTCRNDREVEFEARIS